MKISGNNKRGICKVFIFPLMVLLVACGGRNEGGKGSGENQVVPPSVSGEKVDHLVKLTNQEVAELKIQTVEVSRRFRDFILEVPAVVFPATNHISIISTPIDGQIGQILVQEGESVQKGEVLFRIQSLEYGNMISEYLQAVSEETFETSRLARLKQLVEQTISSQSDLDRALSDYQRAKTAVIAAVAKLKAVGVSDREIEAFRHAEKIDPTLKIYSPIQGVLDNRAVELGQSVNALERLAQVLDLSHVSIRGYASPDDARLIHVGDSVKISVRINDRMTRHAVVTSINPGLDENNRSVVVNILLATVDGWPKPGENLQLAIKTASQKEVITVPMEALTYDGNDPILFVYISESVYEKRIVKVSEIYDQYAVVEEGLKMGEKIASTQVFSLKALSRFDKIAEE